MTLPKSSNKALGVISERLASEGLSVTVELDIFGADNKLVTRHAHKFYIGVAQQTL